MERYPILEQFFEKKHKKWEQRVRQVYVTACRERSLVMVRKTKGKISNLSHAALISTAKKARS